MTWKFLNICNAKPNKLYYFLLQNKDRVINLQMLFNICIPSIHFYFLNQKVCMDYPDTDYSKRPSLYNTMVSTKIQNINYYPRLALCISVKYKKYYTYICITKVTI